MIVVGVNFCRQVLSLATKLSKFSLLCKFKTLVNPWIKFMDLSSYEVKGVFRRNSSQTLTVFLNVMQCQIPFGGHRTDCGLLEISTVFMSNRSSVLYIPIGKTGRVEFDWKTKWYYIKAWAVATTIFFQYFQIPCFCVPLPMGIT